VNVSATVRRLPDTRRWLRVADRSWADPLDPSWARDHGGRWNPPGSFPTLYLNEDLATARSQLFDLFAGWPANPEDLRDDAPYVLVVAELPRRQMVAGAIDGDDLGHLGLAPTYPLDEDGEAVPWSRCQPVGSAVRAAARRGVHCRSAATTDGRGRELAWFPAGPGSRARAVGPPLGFVEWWAVDPAAI
jgi:hypothetical protein